MMYILKKFLLILITPVLVKNCILIYNKKYLWNYIIDIQHLTA